MCGADGTRRQLRCDRPGPGLDGARGRGTARVRQEHSNPFQPAPGGRTRGGTAARLAHRIESVRTGGEERDGEAYAERTRAR